MDTNSIILIVVAIALAIATFWLRKRNPMEKFRHPLQMIGFICCMLSIIAIIISYYYSGDETQLFKLILPFMILLVFFMQNRSGKKS